MTVVDASVVYKLILNPQGRHADEIAEAGELAGPALLDLEVAQKLRWDVRNGRLDSAQDGERAVQRLGLLPIERHDHRAHLPRIWALRDNLTAYDAAYVALAEHLGATLFTGDGRLSRASGIRCPVRVVR
jgi:predicted nucleic acid-binding protein